MTDLAMVPPSSAVVPLTVYAAGRRKFSAMTPGMSMRAADARALIFRTLELAAHGWRQDRTRILADSKDRTGTIWTLERTDVAAEE